MGAPRGTWLVAGGCVWQSVESVRDVLVACCARLPMRDAVRPLVCCCYSDTSRETSVAIMMLPSGIVARGAVLAGVSVAAVGLTSGWDDAREWGGKIANGVAGALAVAVEVIPEAKALYHEIRGTEPGLDSGGGGEFRESPEGGVVNASGVLPAASWSALYWAPGPGGVLSA